MAPENVNAISQAYEQFARGDFSAFDEVTDDFEFVTSLDVPDPGTYRSEDAKRWMRTWVETFDEITFSAGEMLGAAEKVLVEMIQRGRPRGSDSFVDGRWWQVITMRDGRVARIQMFTERPAALTAAGLSTRATDMRQG